MSPRWLANLKELFTHEQDDADLERELHAHLGAETDDQIEQGVPPGSAELAGF
jgi:hypothetical protein